MAIMEHWCDMLNTSELALYISGLSVQVFKKNIDNITKNKGTWAIQKCILGVFQTVNFFWQLADG